MTDEERAGVDVAEAGSVTIVDGPQQTIPTRVVVRAFGRTDVGHVREHNEDNFMVEDLASGAAPPGDSSVTWDAEGGGLLFGVCDGMGGALAGEVASKLATEIVSSAMRAGALPRDREEVGARLVAAMEAAGREIHREAAHDRSRRGMGTTATIAALFGRDLLLGQVGDSRAYILRGGRLVQVTRDQSLVNQLIEAGQLTEEEAETFEHNNIILQALGTASDVDVDLTYVQVRSGDTLMLCSDGLTGMMRKEEIRKVLSEEDDPIGACRRLVEGANRAGGVDNVTVIVAKFEGDLPFPTDQDIEELKCAKFVAREPTSMDTERAPASMETSDPFPEPDSASRRSSVGSASDDTTEPLSHTGLAVVGPAFAASTIPRTIAFAMALAASACFVIAAYYLLS